MNMNYYYNNTTTNPFKILASLNNISPLISLSISVLTIVAMWKIFEKAGEEGWKAIIPVYNIYIMFKIAGKKSLFGIYLASIIAMIILPIIIIVISLASDTNTSKGAGILLAIAVILALALVCFIINICMYVGLTKKFNLSGGFVAGLIFLNTIFYCIIGFSKNITYSSEDNYNNAQPMMNNIQNTQMTQNNNTNMNDQNQPTQTQSFGFCTYCGSKLTTDSTFCPNCGSKLK